MNIRIGCFIVPFLFSLPMLGQVAGEKKPKPPAVSPEPQAAMEGADRMKRLRKAAEQGHADAQFMLGAGYHLGMGVPQDYAESVKWCRKAAEQGHADAKYMLGASYDVGQGVPQNYVEAVKWYRKAAEQGHKWAQYMLGASYGLDCVNSFL